jgi:hypothetical protein
MRQSRAQKKAELQARAEVLIERLLDWDERTERPNLTQIEDEILQLRQEFGEAMVSVTLAGQEAGQPAEPAVCSGCGQPMRYTGKKRKDVECRIGSLQVARGHYHCPDCATGFFPP